LDSGIKLLHDATGNTKLLKTAAGGDINVYRKNTPRTPNDSAYMKNLAASIWFLNDTPLHSNGKGAAVMVHELAHFRDESTEGNPYLADFRNLSGWVQNPTSTDGLTRATNASGGWWYRSDATFATNYSKTNPFEDWAESVMCYFYPERGNLDAARSYYVRQFLESLK
jgi:hypothetical protein